MKETNCLKKPTRTIDILPFAESIRLFAITPEFHARFCTASVCDSCYAKVKELYPLTLTQGIQFLKRFGLKGPPPFVPEFIHEMWETNNADGHSWVSAEQLVFDEK